MSHNFNSNVSVHRIRIPSQVTVKQISAGFVVSESSNFLTQTRSSTLLQFVGPLGSIEMNLQKIDKYGLSFFKISHTASQFCNLQKKEILSLHSAANNEAYLELYVKKMAPTKSLTIAPKFKIVDSIIQKNDGLFQTQSNLNNYPASQISAGLLGTLTSLCKNALEGVSIGFVVYLELVGVGYKANIIQTPCSLSRTKVPLVASGIERKPLTSATTFEIEFKLGQSHDIFYKLPSSIKAFSIKPTMIGLYSIDKAELNQVAAEIRNIKLPEPYKGKGIRFKDEIIKNKIGKKK